LRAGRSQGSKSTSASKRGSRQTKQWVLVRILRRLRVRERLTAADERNVAWRCVCGGRNEQSASVPHQGASCIGMPVRAGGPIGRRQDEPRRCASGARAGYPALRVVHDAPAAPRRNRRRPLSFHRRAPLSRLKDQDEFLEHAHVHGNWYATSATWLAAEVARGTTFSSRSTGKARSRFAG
jgi:hypothetical protein